MLTATEIEAITAHIERAQAALEEAKQQVAEGQYVHPELALRTGIDHTWNAVYAVRKSGPGADK